MDATNAITMTRSDRDSKQTSIRVYQQNESWWVGEPNTSGAISAIIKRTQAEVVADAERLGFRK